MQSALLDTYLSMARGYKAQTFVISEKVCEPVFLSVMIRLSVQGSENIQFMAHRALQHILLLDPPFEVLNQAVIFA